MPLCFFHSNIDQKSIFINRQGDIKMIEIGKKAPDFCVASAQKDNICLNDHNGQWVVLFFYPKDNTSG